MQIAQCKGPGIDAELIERLRLWGIETLTEIQQLAIKAGVADGQSMVVCAPTSSGKTLVGEIALLTSLKKGRRCIYLVSHKALADQKYDDFERRFGEKAGHPLGSVGLSTGDRDEGEINPQLLVATYEKALGLILSGQLDARASLVIADELQIIGEPNRGPNIEALCAILRQREVAQFVALTATVGNSRDLASWLNCALVNSQTRDIDLHQEIWFQGEAYRVTFGQESGEQIAYSKKVPCDTLDAVDFLLSNGRGPVLVFTESRREATEFAETYSQQRTRTTDGIAIAEQLDLFSEPTEASEKLKANAERKVAFHTADLTQQERQVIEQGLVGSKFEVCFATTTLAAGVNFPFQTVVIPKLTYQWSGRTGQQISRSNYRNMSGRAGRLGLHEKGYSILLPPNRMELTYANQLVLPQNDDIVSQLVSISMRRTVLMLVSSGIVDRREALEEFFKHTFYWYQISEKNTKKLGEVVATANKSVDWLIKAQLIDQHEETFLPTPLGKAIAQTGLHPSTATNFVEVLDAHATNMDDDFEKYITGILHWACSSDEFNGDKPSRFLAYPIDYKPVASTDFLRSSVLLAPLDRTNNTVNQCSHALALYAQGESERQIRFKTNISSGGIHRLALDVGWVIDGLHRIACVPDIGCSQQLANKLSLLGRRVRWGAPADALDIIRVAERHGVPGFGRQRAMALIAQGLATFEEILGAAKEKLIPILRSENRAKSLLAAISGSIGIQTDRYAKVHQRVATELGLEHIVARCKDRLGVEYEEAIKYLLDAEASWTVTVIDDGKRQNVPDLLVELDNLAVLIECKTTTKTPPLIKKEEAFAVLQKAADFDKNIRRITLGKPSFDESSKLKAQASPDITLIEHSIFIEGLLRVLTGTITPKEFLLWIGTPGVSEIDRLAGSSTYEVSVTKRANSR